MKRRKLIWLVVAAFLWAWAAVVAGVLFPEIPALFSNAGASPASDNINQTLYRFWARYELVIFTAFLLFMLLNNPSRKIWLSTAGLGILLVIKVIWLAPLLDSHLHWQFSPLAYLPHIYVSAELVKFILLLLTSYWLFNEITSIARVEERYRQFINTRNKMKKHFGKHSGMGLN
jgi:hypothetical protein